MRHWRTIIGLVIIGLMFSGCILVEWIGSQFNPKYRKTKRSPEGEK